MLDWIAAGQGARNGAEQLFNHGHQGRMVQMHMPCKLWMPLSVHATLGAQKKGGPSPWPCPDQQGHVTVARLRSMSGFVHARDVVERVPLFRAQQGGVVSGRCWQLVRTSALWTVDGCMALIGFVGCTGTTDYRCCTR